MILNLEHARPLVIALLVLGAASTFVRGQRTNSSAGSSATADDTGLVGDDAAEPDAVDSLDEMTTSNVSSPPTPISHDDPRKPPSSKPTVNNDNYPAAVISTTRPSATDSNRVQRRVQVYSDYETAQPKYYHQHIAGQPDPIDVKNSQAIRKSVEKLRAAKDHDSRQETADELKKLLETAFDRDYERRNNELAKLEERVTKLRAQLDRRKESRNDIIDVRVKSLLYEAEGIGFPAELGAAPQGSVYLRGITLPESRPRIRPVPYKTPAQAFPDTGTRLNRRHGR